MENGVYKISATKGIEVRDGKGRGVLLNGETLRDGTDREFWTPAKDGAWAVLADAQIAFLSAKTLDALQEVSALAFDEWNARRA